MKHDGVIADHGGSAARRHRRGGNATTCLGPRMPPTISLRRAEFYVARTTGRLTGSPRGWAMSSVRPLTPENRSAGSSSTFWPLAPRTPAISRGASIMRAGPSFQATGAAALFGPQGGHPGRSNGPGTGGHTIPDALAARALCMAQRAAPSTKFCASEPCPSIRTSTPLSFYRRTASQPCKSDTQVKMSDKGKDDRQK